LCAPPARAAQLTAGVRSATAGRGQFCVASLDGVIRVRTGEADDAAIGAAPGGRCHDSSVVRRAQRIGVMSRGRLSIRQDTRA
jgi:hypothetical protein